MGETDEEGRPVKVWRKADRKDFKKFLFCVVGKRQRSDLTKRTTPQCPETLCGFITVKGVQLATRSGLKNVVGLKAGDGYIRTYCNKKGLTPPWEVEPEQYIISKTQKAQLDRTQARMIAVSPGTGYSTSSGTMGNAEIKSLQGQMANLERQFSNFQPLTGSGSSLDSILAKLDERMASIEKKVEKIDVLESTGMKLAGYMNVLSARFDKLEASAEQGTGDEQVTGA